MIETVLAVSAHHLAPVLRTGSLDQFSRHFNVIKSQ